MGFATSEKVMALEIVRDGDDEVSMSQLGKLTARELNG